MNDWIHLITQTNILWFLFWIGIFGGYAWLGGGIKWILKFISNHMTKMKQMNLEVEKKRGENLDKQLELERMRRATTGVPKQPKIITPDDLVFEEKTYQEGTYEGRYYEEIPKQQ